MSNNIDFKLKNAVEVGKDTKVTLGSITSSDIDLATGNYFAETLAADTTYTLSNAGGVQSFQLEVTGGAVGYDLSAAVYDSVSFSVASQDTIPEDIAISSDGTKLHVLGRGDNGDVYQYTLSTAFDLSTASYDTAFSIASQASTCTGLTFGDNGNKMYVVESASDFVHQYSLSSAFDISTASYDSKSFSVNAQETQPTGLTFNNSGTKMYVCGSTGDDINQYSLSTAWDISTASYASITFSVSAQESVPTGIRFNTDGTKLFIIGASGDDINQYSLSTAFDLSTASYDSVTFSVAAQETVPTGLVFSSDGTKMYIVGEGSDTVYQYSTASDFTLTWPSSIEWAGGVAPSAPANGETDVFTFVTDDSGTSYVGLKTADNLS